MLDYETFCFFGKLRRRRDFLKSKSFTNEAYFFWESWINKCSRKNSFLPFLDRNFKSNPVWLFIVKDEKNIKIGLTMMSMDMSERKFPFSLYYEIPNFSTELTDDLIELASYLVQRYYKFKRIISIGDFETADRIYFCSEKNNNPISDVLEDIIKIATQEIVDSHILMSFSHWINLENGIHFQHDGGFSCSLYNKIYG